MSPPPDTRLSRRAALRAGAAALTTSLTGCSGLPPLGSKVRYGTVPTPDAGAPTYREWLPAPSAFPEVDENYQMMVYTPPSSDAEDWARTSVPRAVLVSYTDYLGVHIDDVDLAVTGGEVAVLVGEFDPSAVADTVGRTSYEPAGTVEEYDVYRRPDTETVAAVKRGRLLFSGGASSRDNVEAGIGAHRGELPRYHEQESVFADLSESAGTRRWNWLVPGGIRPGREDGILSDTIGWATGFEHDDESVYYVQTWLFPSSYDLTESAVKESLNQRERAMDATAVDIDISGRTATITSQLRHERFLAEHANDGFLVPYATWRGRYDETAEQLTIRHEAGDTVSTEGLSVRGDEDEFTIQTDDGPRIEPGDSITVSTAGVAAGTTVQLIYESADGDRSSALFDYDVP